MFWRHLLHPIRVNLLPMHRLRHLSVRMRLNGWKALAFWIIKGRTDSTPVSLPATDGSQLPKRDVLPMLQPFTAAARSPWQPVSHRKSSASNTTRFLILSLILPKKALKPAVQVPKSVLSSPVKVPPVSTDWLIHMLYLRKSITFSTKATAD